MACDAMLCHGIVTRHTRVMAPWDAHWLQGKDSRCDAPCAFPTDARSGSRDAASKRSTPHEHAVTPCDCVCIFFLCTLTDSGQCHQPGSRLFCPFVSFFFLACCFHKGRSGAVKAGKAKPRKHSIARECAASIYTHTLLVEARIFRRWLLRSSVYFPPSHQQKDQAHHRSAQHALLLPFLFSVGCD